MRYDLYWMASKHEWMKKIEKILLMGDWICFPLLILAWETLVLVEYFYTD